MPGRLAGPPPTTWRAIPTASRATMPGVWPGTVREEWRQAPAARAENDLAVRAASAGSLSPARRLRPGGMRPGLGVRPVDLALRYHDRHLRPVSERRPLRRPGHR